MGLLSFIEARELILQQAQGWGNEIISLEDCIGRTMGEDVFADRDYPPFNRSAMDGFAIKASDFNSNKEYKIIEELYAGSTARKKINSGEVIKIMTGAPVPVEADAVIRIEDSEINGTNVTFTITELKQWANIAKQGEDTAKGNLVLKKGTVITAGVMASLAAIGCHQVKVAKLPKVSIVSTGDEVKSPSESVLPHQIRDSNSFILKSCLANYCIVPHTKLLVKDQPEIIKETLQRVSYSDILILSGGVSMGDADFIPQLLEDSGVKIIFYKTAIKPGKPILVGITSSNQLIFALPGNPVSCMVTYKIFIEPFLRKSFSLEPYKILQLPLLREKKKKTKFDEFFSCKIVTSEQKTFVDQVKSNGSGDLFSTLHSDGIALHPSSVSDLKHNDYVDFYLWKSL